MISSFLDIFEVGAGFEGVQDWAAERSSVSAMRRACNRGTTECHKERRLLVGSLRFSAVSTESQWAWVRVGWLPEDTLQSWCRVGLHLGLCATRGGLVLSPFWTSYLSSFGNIFRVVKGLRDLGKPQGVVERYSNPRRSL